MSRHSPRYPGDQDPSNLGFASERRFIAGAILELRPSDRKVIKDLIENPLVDRVTTRSDREDTAEFLTIVVRSGLMELSWIAYTRDYGSKMYDPERVDRFIVRRFRTTDLQQYPTAKEAAEAFLYAAALEPRPNPIKASARRDLHDFFKIVRMPKNLCKPIEAAAMYYDMEIEDIARALRRHKSHYGDADRMIADLDTHAWSTGIAAKEIETSKESLDDLMVTGMRLLDHYGISYMDREEAGIILSGAPFSLAMVAIGKSKDAVRYVLRDTLAEIGLTIDGVDYEYEPEAAEVILGGYVSEGQAVLAKKHAKNPFDPKKRK